MTTIALIDGDRATATAASSALAAEGFETAVFADGKEAVAAMVENPPDLAVVDFRAGGVSGMEVLRRLRRTASVPVIFVSGSESETDEISGFKVGADDFLHKPFSNKVLLARIHAILRRRSKVAKPAGRGEEAAEPSGPLKTGPLTLVVETERFYCGEERVRLTATEFKLMRLFMARPGVVYSRNAVMDAVYPDDVYVDERTVDSHVKRLRAKLKRYGLGRAIETLYGVGYRVRDLDGPHDGAIPVPGRSLRKAQGGAA